MKRLVFRIYCFFQMLRLWKSLIKETPNPPFFLFPLKPSEALQVAYIVWMT